jgi:hypothetical protein
MVFKNGRNIEVLQRSMGKVNETTASDSAPILPGAFRLRGAQAWGSII